jgi:hypothetical protein
MIDLGDLDSKISTSVRCYCYENIPSIRILINKICIAFKGLLSPKKVLSVINVNAAIAVLSWKDKKFWILWKIDFPLTIN